MSVQTKPRQRPDTLGSKGQPLLATAKASKLLVTFFTEGNGLQITPLEFLCQILRCPNGESQDGKRWILTGP